MLGLFITVWIVTNRQLDITEHRQIHVNVFLKQVWFSQNLILSSGLLMRSSSKQEEGGGGGGHFYYNVSHPCEKGGTTDMIFRGVKP